MSLNKVVISGNLTRDSELRITSSNLYVLNFTVAVNERIKDAQGNWVDRTDFLRCTVWGKRAESLERYLKKGNKVCVSGRIRTGSYEKNGVKRDTFDIVADDVELMSAKPGYSEDEQSF